MPKKTTTPARWFDAFPPVNPPGWDDKNGWCRRHWAPLTIGDPAQRDTAQRLASLELMVSFASRLRRKVAPLPVPAHYLTDLVRYHAPVCCYVGDGQVQAIILAAQVTAQTGVPHQVA